MPGPASMHEPGKMIQARVIAVCTSPGGLPKTPREEAVWIGHLGLDGDAQRDRRVHGGPSQAVCVYLESDYAAFRSEGLSLPGPGAFGENLTLGDLSSHQVHIGDRWSCGGLLLEVTQLRMPCRNLEVHGEDMPARVRETGRTGFYCRVLSPGALEAGSRLTRESAGTLALPEVLRLWWHERRSADPQRRRAATERLLAEPALGERWRVTLEEAAAQI